MEPSEPSDRELDSHALAAAVVREHMEFVRLIAKEEIARYRSRASYEDAVQYGLQGLLVAHQRFDARCGFKFRTYAEPLIRYSIRDGVKKMANLHRTVTPSYSVPYDEHADNIAALGNQHTGVVQDQKAVRLDLTRAARDARAFAYGWAGVVDASDVGEEEWALVLHAISTLPQPERRIVEHRYVHNPETACCRQAACLRQDQELTKELGLAKSSISRHHENAILLLQKRFKALSDCND